MSDRRRNLFILLAVVGLICASVAVVATKQTKLGLDLQGGVSLVYQGKAPKGQPTITQDSIARAVDIIRERVDALGVAEPQIAQSGKDLIEVSLPAVKNAESAAQQVGTTAQMYFYDWEPNVLDQDCRTNADQVNGGQTAIAGFINAVKRATKCDAQADKNNTNASGTRFYGFDKAGRPLNGGLPETTEAKLFDPTTQRPDNKTGKQVGDQTFKVPEGILIVRQERSNPKLPKPDAWFVIKDNPVLSGTEIKNPEQNFDQTTNDPIVTMNFSDKGKKAFAATTKAIAQRGADNALPGQNPVDASHHFAIVLDNELVSTPYINFNENPDGIDGSNGAQISGGFTIQSAQDLAKFLKIGALPIELKPISRSQVSATLGKQALDQGLVAGIAGFIVVALFLLVFYRVLGLIAVGALAVYAPYFFALIKLIPIVMTLPGIAGLILTLGVAADANIVIFERVKEEIRGGRSIPAGIATGYKKGFATILDANIVTLLVAFILFILATAVVKGFAFVLGIGTLVSLFTAVLATQAVLGTLGRSRMMTHPAALGAGE
ncbi:MAG: SecD/SecF fusion protein, partial [Candidatus Eremiobacteraeota bacterium]|nr:SecD/SecF fusion protein [Candidatus Eremiobacteraeota bacterium]